MDSHSTNTHDAGCTFRLIAGLQEARVGFPWTVVQVVCDTKGHSLSVSSCVNLSLWYQKRGTFLCAVGH